MGLLTRRSRRQLVDNFPCCWCLLFWLFWALESRAELGNVFGVISTTAWYAAVRGLPCCQDLSDRILIHLDLFSFSERALDAFFCFGQA